MSPLIFPLSFAPLTPKTSHPSLSIWFSPSHSYFQFPCVLPLPLQVAAPAAEATAALAQQQQTAATATAFPASPQMPSPCSQQQQQKLVHVPAMAPVMTAEAFSRLCREPPLQGPQVSVMPPEPCHPNHATKNMPLLTSARWT